MQSPTQTTSGTGPATTATTGRPPDWEADGKPPTPGQQESHGKENQSASSVEKDGVTRTPEDGTPGEDRPRGDGRGSQQKAPSATTPGAKTNRGRPAPKGNPQAEAVKDKRKYVPSKKAMIDPLKMDMSKPLVIPLTSSQLSMQCMECHIIFCDHKSHVRHLKLSHPAEYEQSILRNALFACYVCDQHFPNSSELMVHQKAHVDKKPFKCPLCNQAFTKSSELTRHKKIHFGRDGYSCIDCGKSFKTLTLLKYHRRTHTGERPYVCKECGKRFTMQKPLQKHMLSHVQDGANEEEGGATVKRPRKKKDDASAVKYACSVCKATFKTTKTQQRHMKNKHNVSPAALGSTGMTEQQRKQSTPIITPISICQPGLLQVEPDGPLQKVDANIDTEPIRRLIESLGNVQKVNQVVILGQVPPDAAPLEVQHMSHFEEPLAINPHPPEMDFIGLKQAEGKTVDLDFSNNPCDPMEQTIILEPITPDGQLDNAPFSELASHISAGENLTLGLVPSEQTAATVHDVIPQPEMNAVRSNAIDPTVCRGADGDLGRNLEQTVILELAPALMPTEQLERSQNEERREIPSSSLVPATELETTAEQTVAGGMSGLSVQPLVPSVDLDPAPLPAGDRDRPACDAVPPDMLTQVETVADSKGGTEAQMPGSLGEVQAGTEAGEMQDAEEKTLQEEKTAPDEGRRSGKGRTEKQREGEEPSSTVAPPAKPGAKKHEPKIPDLPVNVMSAQELVKVRKRKPARAFILQGHMQELVGPIQGYDYQNEAKPTKRQRTKKSHLVVKFGPQSKERKNKKQKKQSQRCQPAAEEAVKEKANSLPEKKVPSQKKGRKGNKGKRGGNSEPAAEIKENTLTQEALVQRPKEDARRKKMKKQGDAAAENAQHVTKQEAVFKKKIQSKMKQKSQPPIEKNGRMASKVQAKKRGKNNIKQKAASANTPGPQITQDSLLLLKGHKQPQLKVHKLDPTKASAQTQEPSPLEPQAFPPRGKDKRASESANNLPAEDKKKKGRTKKTQKALSLLSFLKVSHQPSEAAPARPKTTRKRKASANVETEGVITASHSKRTLECKDCGERFGEVSSLQKHKATVHIVESPDLMYTNGNIFEGVSKERVGEATDAATGWDTEPEMPLDDRERSLSFPALIPSPSLPFTQIDAEASRGEDRAGGQTETGGLSPVSPSSSHQVKDGEPLPSFSESSPDIPTRVETAVTEEPSDGNKGKESVASVSETRPTEDEDVKEDVLLEVDLVTVGEPSDKDGALRKESDEARTADVLEDEAAVPLVLNEAASAAERLSAKTVSCETQQVEVKDEDEEVLVQKKKELGRGPTGKKHGVLPKEVWPSNVLAGTESEADHDDCQVVYKSPAVAADSQTVAGDDARAQTSQTKTGTEFELRKCAASATSLPPVQKSPSEESSEKQVAFETGSVSTAGAEAVDDDGDGGERRDRDADRSPGIILEKVLSSGGEECSTAWRKTPRRGLETENYERASGSREIKVEETTADPTFVAPACQNRANSTAQSQHHRDIRTVLVKEESSLVQSDVQATQESVGWNSERVSSEPAPTPLTEMGEVSGCAVAPDFDTQQCIFYPVKEEEREVLLGAAQTDDGCLATEASADGRRTQEQRADCFLYDVTQDCQDTRVRCLQPELMVDDLADLRADMDAEWQNPTDALGFLLQGADEEDAESFQLSRPQVDSEARAMAYFSKNQNGESGRPDTTTSSLPNLNPKQVERGSGEPVEYFSKFFGWDTWAEFAHNTNRSSSASKDFTAREVAQFVGIHIAMGTLKFPSPRLYWEDLTRVPLIAEAMPLSRFTQLCGRLKLSSAADPDHGKVGGERNNWDFQDARREESSVRCDRQPQRTTTTTTTTYVNCSKTQVDPLWRVQPVLSRFHKGCRSIRRDGYYAVDQYQLPLTGKTHSTGPSLHCTTLIGFGGLLLHVDLKPDPSDKEDAVEKMLPKGSMVFLCKQELSTPAMLERLLVAGIHGAGRVGGARGQIGDEFVSSDGKLMLRKSHCGFILSTAGNGQRHRVSLIDDFEKAQMSTRLNRDLRGLYKTPLAAAAPTCWPQAVLWYLTDLALVNSWLLYRQERRAEHEPLTLMAFRMEVSKALILSSSSDTQDSIPPQPPTEKANGSNETPNPSLVEESPLPDAATRYDNSGHWPEQLAEGEGGRCRFGDCQRTSRVLCLKCCVFLCISRNHNCFLNFHNQGTLEKQ